MAGGNSTFYIIGALMGVATLGLLAVLIYYKATKKKYASNKSLYQKDQIVVKNKTGIKDIFDRIFQVAYLVLIKIPVVKHYTKKTRL